MSGHFWGGCLTQHRDKPTTVIKNHSHRFCVAYQNIKVLHPVCSKSEVSYRLEVSIKNDALVADVFFLWVTVNLHQYVNSLLDK